VVRSTRGVCLRSFDSPVEVRKVETALADAGVVIQPDKGDPNGVPLLLFLERVDESAPEAVRRAVGEGRRVLCITYKEAANPAAAIAVLNSGAEDIICWTASRAEDVRARLARWNDVDEWVARLRARLVGHSPAWTGTLRQLVEAALYLDRDKPVLIVGETGTGKELAARALYTVACGETDVLRTPTTFDCTTIVPTLAGSELFGHERGAFTGAVADRDGVIAQAHGGTLFLDEIGELPRELQPQLLRAVQERSFRRVGGNVWRTADFRLVCASGKDLAAEVANGSFRSDLYYRVSTVTINLPSLRERTGDIGPLVERFIAQLSRQNPPQVSDPVLDYLKHRDYPGNVRELRQLVTAMMHRHVGTGPLGWGDLPVQERRRAESASDDTCAGELRAWVSRAVGTGEGRSAALSRVGDALYEEALRVSGHDPAAAAGLLRVTPRAIQKYVQRRDAVEPDLRLTEPGESVDDEEQASSQKLA